MEYKELIETFEQTAFCLKFLSIRHEQYDYIRDQLEFLITTFEGDRPDATIEKFKVAAWARHTLDGLNRFAKDVAMMDADKR